MTKEVSKNSMFDYDLGVILHNENDVNIDKQ